MSLRRLVSVFLAFAVGSTVTSAQTIAITFDDLRDLLKPDDYLIVIEREDRETWGRFAEVSSSTLAVLPVRQRSGNGSLEIAAKAQVFSAESVTGVFRSDASGRKGEALYPASWHAVDALPVNTDVEVVLASGERRQYRFLRADADNLRVLAQSGQHDIPKSQVRRVELTGVNDGAADGLVVGALIGAGAGLGMMTIAYANICDTCDAPARGPMFAAAASFSAGIGAVTGLIVDKLHKGRRVQFPVVSPVLTRQRQGVAISLRF